MTEAEVRATGRPALVGKRAMKDVKRAVEKGETHGFIKVLVDAGRTKSSAPRFSAPAATKWCTRSST